MGPDKRLVPISFAGGIDTKTDPKQLVPGKLLDLQNGIFQQTGAINRRWGYKALGTGILGTSSVIAAAYAVQAFNNELLLYDGLSAYSYIPATDNWAQRGSIVSVIETNSQVIANSSQQLSPDFGTLNGIEVYAWEDSRGGIRYSVRDASTGAFLLVDQPLFAGMGSIIRPKVMPFPPNNALAIFFADSAGHLGYVPISTAAPAQASAPVYLFSGLPTPVMYDAVASNNLVFLVYYTGLVLGNLTYTTARLSNLQSVDWSIIAFGHFSQNIQALNIAASATNVWISFGGYNGTNLVVEVLARNQATSGGFAGHAILNAAVGTTISALAGTVTTVAGVETLNVFIDVQDPGGNPSKELLYFNTGDVNGSSRYSTSPPVFLRSVGLASKAFQYNGAVYVNVAYQSPNNGSQSTYFTIDGSGRVVAKIFPGLCGGLIQNSDSILPECPAIAPGIFKFTNLIRGTVNTVGGQVVALLGVNATKLDFADTNHFLSESLNGDLYTIGGILQVYDGAQYVEHGFHVYPEAIVATPSASGGSMATGAYNYVFTYEWVNNNNQNDISAPSFAIAVNVTGPTGSVQFTIPTLRLTKKSRVKIVVYRTTATGTILYRVTSALVPLYNDPTVDTVTFTDTLADASVTSNGAMYTQPLNVNAGNPVLPNSAPPSCSLIATFDDRIILSGLDDPYSWWMSEQAIPGAPAQFAAALAQRLDPDGGSITALVRMDDKLVFFKSNAIFYISGSGPTATGDGSQLTTPALIPSGEVGCISQNAVVLTPIGILFQSANGIYLLDRALNVTYKGAPVEKYTSPNQLGLTITSATLVPNQWAIFTTTSGTALVYDFFYDQWSTFTNHAAVDSDLYLGQGNVLVWASPSGQVYKQTPTTFTDAGVPIVFDMTMLLQFAGLQGYQRIYHLFLLGQFKGSPNGSHILNCWGAFDFDDAFTALSSIPVDGTLGMSLFGSSSPFGNETPFGGVGPGQSVFQFRLDVVRKCQAMKLRVTDSQAAPGDEAFSLSALSALVGVKKGGFKMPAVKQFGVA
jgi:hypothetical protein